MSDEAVVDSNTLKDSGTVVEKVVDTGPLLEKLQSTSEKGSVSKKRNAEWLASEAFHPGTLSSALLFVDVILHLLEVRVDQLVVGVMHKASETGH